MTKKLALSLIAAVFISVPAFAEDGPARAVNASAVIDPAQRAPTEQECAADRHLCTDGRSNQNGTPIAAAITPGPAPNTTASGGPECIRCADPHYREPLVRPGTSDVNENNLSPDARPTTRESRQ